MKRMISWNVNGIRAILKKNFEEFFAEIDADIFCLQETKITDGLLKLDLPGYFQFWNYAERKGYSGTAIFTREEPIDVIYGLGLEEHDTEGRVITAEFPDYFVVTVYTPNSQDGLRRLAYRCVWEDVFREYLVALDKIKPVILCGDLNVAHREIDLTNPKTNRMSAGFTDEEREKFGLLLDAGFTDTFRHFYPDAEERYSWWSYRTRARERNAGWRIDYFVTSQSLNDRLAKADILDQVMGSDHCPVLLEIS